MRYAVMVVTEGQSSSHSLQAVFDESSELELVDVLDVATDVLQAVSRREVHVVLVDAAVSWESPYAIVRDLQGRMPHIPVLLIDASGSVQALEQAVEAGARGVLSLEESYDEVNRKVLSAAQWSMKVRGLQADDAMLNAGPSRIVSVVGSKGGVGTTSLALLLARQHRALGRKVCIVDLDLTKGDVAHYASIAARRDMADLLALGDGVSVQAIHDVVYVDRAGLAHLCAPEHPERGEAAIGERVRAVAITLRQVYEYVIIDCGAMPSDAMAAALEVSDDVTVVVNPELSSIRGAKRLIDMCTRLSIRSAEEINVIVNRANRRSELQPSTIRRMLTSPVLDRVVEQDDEFHAADAARDFGRVRSRSVLVAVSAWAASHAIEGAEAEPTVTSPSRRANRRRRAETGGVTVEFMMMFPLLMFVFVLCLQVVLYLAADVQAGKAAAAAASAAARGADTSAAARERVNDTFRPRLSVGSPSRNGDYVDVSVRVTVPRLVPAGFMGDGSVEATGSAVQER